MKIIIIIIINVVLLCLLSSNLVESQIFKQTDSYYLAENYSGENERQQFSTDNLETTTDFNYENDYDQQSLSIIVANISSYDCENNTCVVKCCPKDNLYAFSSTENELPECVNVSLYDTPDWKPRNIVNYSLIFGLPSEIFLTSEEENFHCSQYTTNEFHLNDDGTIYLKSLAKKLSQHSYCIDTLLDEGRIEEYALICHKEINTETNYVIVTNDLHTTAVALSVISLFIIILMFVFTPNKLDLQKRCTFACCVSLFLGFFGLLINKTPIVETITFSENSGCLILGILTQVFLLSFYFWLNINCFEIFRIIRGTFNLQSISDLSQTTGRFSVYCLYCYCCPLFISAVTLTMQLIPLTDFPIWIRPYIVKPNINDGTCWLEDGKSEFVYYYTFEIILHIVNAFFMGHTFYLLYKENLISTFCRRETSTVRMRTHAAVNHLDAFKQQLRIYLMYMFIWIINCVSLINKHASFWRITDFIVALQGVFVVLFILQTSRNTLVTPLYEKISKAAKELSSRIGEKRNIHSENTETSEIF